MRIVVMPGRAFASRERSLLQRLEVGLASEGIRVVHAIPAGSRLASEPDVFSQVLAYDARGLSFTRGIRARRLVEQLRALPRASDEQAVDVVHAFDDSWPFAVEVARATGAALAVEFWSAAMTKKASAIRSAAHDVAGLVMLAPDPAIERLLQREVEGVSVRHVPWGVHCPTETSPILQPDRAPSLVVSATGAESAPLEAVIEGLSRVMEKFEETIVLCDAHAARRANVWPMIRRLGLEDRFTMTPLLEGTRELPLKADLLVLPEAAGEFKSITLDAMAAGMAVVAMDDPSLSYLQSGRTATLVAGPDPLLWSEAILELLENPDRARELGTSAHAFVRDEHRVSVHVANVIDAYEWMTSGDALRIGARTSAR
jgi:glycosyltransferase involved in cell wall biosynthesis